MVARKDADSPASKRPPATTPQARENQLINLAYDEAEKQIREGKATSQLLTHFLKMGSPSNDLALDKLRAENKLLLARVESLASNDNKEALYMQAIAAMKSYQGGEPTDEQNY